MTYPPVQLRLLKVNPVTADEAVDAICTAGQGARGFVVVNPNLSHLSRLRRDPEYRKLYDKADLAVPDGWPVVRMLHAHGATRAVRLVGTDLLPLVCAEAERRGLSVGFLGGAGDAAERAAAATRETYPRLDVPFWDSAPPGFDRDDASFEAWRAGLPERWADIVFVGLGEPKQTLVSLRLRDDPRARVLMGVGKAVEFVGGLAPRAPAWAVDRGWEWLHRALTEPRRLGPRYLQGALDIVPLYLAERRDARKQSR